MLAARRRSGLATERKNRVSTDYARASGFGDGGSGGDLNVELVKFGSWPELMDALNSGRVDGASVLIELAMKAKERGVGLKAVALGRRDGNVAIVSKANGLSDEPPTYDDFVETDF